MPYLGDFAKSAPGKPAVIFAATGEQFSYAELNDRSIASDEGLRHRGSVGRPVAGILRICDHSNITATSRRRGTADTRGTTTGPRSEMSATSTRMAISTLPTAGTS